MAGELAGALLKRHTVVEDGGQVWESRPVPSSADASSQHFEGVSFGNAPSAKEWLAQLGGEAEEDPVREALERLLEGRGPRPPHAPRHDVQQEGLQGLTHALTELQEQLHAESNDLGLRKEELARREADLEMREQRLKAARGREGGPGDYPAPAWLAGAEGGAEGSVNVAVVGNSGVGKSLLINRLRGMRRGSGDWAEVGVKETTRAAAMYALPGESRVRLWDLPGAGTEGFPLESYIRTMGLRYFDSVLIVTAGRFTNTEMQLRLELQAHSVPFFMVRSKVDIDVWNNHEDNGLPPEQTLQQIRNEFKLHFGLEELYLVSSRDPELYDMNRLRFDAFPGLNTYLDKESLIFSPYEKGGWGDAWALPSSHSELLAGIQGHWRDQQDGTKYIVDGSQTHVTLLDGRTAVVPLDEKAGKVWWCHRWSIDGNSVAKARKSCELRWAPTDLRLQPLVWRWVN